MIKNNLVPYWEKLEKYLKDNNIIIEIKSDIVMIIDKNGNIDNVLNIPKESQIEVLSNLFNESKHDGFYIYDKNYKKGYTNKIYFEKVPPKIYYEESKVNFIAIEIEYNTKKYNIDLKNNDSNYYIVNNSLNQNFFKYYLKNVLKISIDEHNFNYICTFIDYNVDIFTLNQNQSLLFNLYDYSIFPFDNSFDYESDKSDDFVKLE
jgi:hypothetical protein